jgi:hypothetical protein
MYIIHVFAFQLFIMLKGHKVPCVRVYVTGVPGLNGNDRGSVDREAPWNRAGFLETYLYTGINLELGNWEPANPLNPEENKNYGTTNTNIL